MGIQDLTALIKAECPEQLETVLLAELEGYKIAVDVSIYLYKYVRSCGETRWLDAFINFVCELKKARLHPVYIFDGPDPPPEKKLKQAARRAQRAKDEDRLREAGRYYADLMQDYVPGNREPPDALQDNVRRLLAATSIGQQVRYDDAISVANALRAKIEIWTNQAIRITPAFGEKAKDVLNLLGLPYLQARGEAETLCAFLGVNGHVDAVLTSDTDVLAYGTPCMISNIGAEHKAPPPRMLGGADAPPPPRVRCGPTTVRVINHQNLCAELDLSAAEFRDLCILLGCDYNRRAKMRGKRVKKRGTWQDGKELSVGRVRAMRLIQEHRTLEEVENFLTDSAALNYRRCRELFTVPAANPGAARFEYASPIAEADFIAFLRENNSRIDKAFIIALWAPPKIQRA